MLLEDMKNTGNFMNTDPFLLQYKHPPYGNVTCIGETMKDYSSLASVFYLPWDCDGTVSV